MGLCGTMIHRGQIVEKIVKKSGHTFTNVAAKLRVSRNTLYNRFYNANLSYSCIAEIGAIIHYDFTVDFPEMQKEIGNSDEHPRALLKPSHRSRALWETEHKYTSLLEKYNKLLALLVKIVNQNELQDLKDEVLGLIEEDKAEADQNEEGEEAGNASEEPKGLNNVREEHIVT